MNKPNGIVLLRCRDPDAREERWRVFCGDVQIGRIGISASVPAPQTSRVWTCSFYLFSNRGRFTCALSSKRPPFGTFRKTCGLVEKQSLSEQFVKRRIPPAPVEEVVAPAAIERALNVYEQLQPHDLPVRRRARKIATQRIYGMVDQGEHDEQRLTIDGVAHLKAVERDAQDAPKKKRKKKVSPSLTK